MTKAVPSAPAAQAGPPPDLPKCNYVSQDIRYHESLRQLQSWASIIFSRHLVIQEPELLPDKTVLLLEYIPAWLASLKYYCIG